VLVPLRKVLITPRAWGCRSVCVSLLSRDRFDFKRLAAAESDLATGTQHGHRGPIPATPAVVEAGAAAPPVTYRSTPIGKNNSPLV
jgi:hypothetical protein